MAIIKLTVEELQKGRVLNPGWYKAKITNVKVEKAKDGGSHNYVYFFSIEGEKVEVKKWFNSKAMGLMAPLIAAIDEKPLQEIVADLNGEDYQFDTDDHIGCVVQIQIDNEIYNGSPTNKPINYLPINADVM